MIVVDASLATKWLVPETDSDVALDFLISMPGLIAGPDILLAEVTGAIVRRANMNPATAAETAIAIDRWVTEWDAGAVIAHRITAPLIAHAAQIAIYIGHPLPDCIYLALAIRLDCDLATCDAKFCDKARSISDRVKLLVEYA